MELRYQVNEHVFYLIYPGGIPTEVSGRLVGVKDVPSHKAKLCLIKRDHALIDNVGMYEIDEVSPMNILGYVIED